MNKCYWDVPLEEAWCEEHQCNALECPIPGVKVEVAFERTKRKYYNAFRALGRD